MSDAPFRPATGKLIVVDPGKGIKLLFRPDELRETKRPRTIEIEMHGTLRQVILLDSHFNTGDLLQLSKLLSPKGVEVTLEHV